MPIYEYTCRDCGTTFEFLVFSGAQPHCPQCEQQNLERVLSVTAPGRVKQAAAAPPPACGGCPSAGACGLDPG